MTADFLERPATCGSVTHWIEQLQEFGPHEELQRQMWQRYFRRLAGVARKHLPGANRRVSDDEDVALSVLRSFFTRLDQGRYPQLESRADLWALLAKIAASKAIKTRVKQNAIKRGGGKVRGDSVFDNVAFASGFQDLPDQNPGPRELSEFNDLVKDLLSKLDPSLLKVAQSRLAGQNIVEIAEHLGVSPRTIERKLARVRTVWKSRLTEI